MRSGPVLEAYPAVPRFRCAGTLKLSQYGKTSRTLVQQETGGEVAAMTRSRRRKLERAATINALGPCLRAMPVATAVLAGMSAAFAQDTDSGGLEQVVVSAQKRDENLQSVPLSIQALGTQKLEELHVQNSRTTPNSCPASRIQALGPGFARVFMRGVSSGDNGNHSGPLPHGRHVPRRAAHHHDSGRARRSHLRHRARGIPGRSAGHAVWRQLAGGHHPHHHEQARPDRLQGGVRPAGQLRQRMATRASSAKGS